MPANPDHTVLPQPAAAIRSAATQPAENWLALDRQLCFALYAGSLAMTKAYKPLLAPLGLTYPQYLAMLVLWAEDGVTVSQLGDRLVLDSGTLTPVLKRLQAQGLVQRQRDAQDERRVRLWLTPKGQALKGQALGVPQALTCSFGCTLDEVQQLTTQLTRLRRHLQAQVH